MKVTTITCGPRFTSNRSSNSAKRRPCRRAQHDAHVLAHAELLARDGVVLAQLGAAQDVGPGGAQVVGVDVGQARLDRLLDRDLGAQEVAPEQRQRIELRGGELHLLVFDQAAHQLGARVFGFRAVVRSSWAAAACAT